MVDFILFPSSYYGVNYVDEDLQSEYDAVVATGLYETAFFSYDQWICEEKFILSYKPDRMRRAIYRGWMMKPEQYKDFYNKLLKANIQLVTSPDEYELMHIFPNVHHLFKNDTAKMELYPLHSQIDVNVLKEKFDRFMVKDYVKSVKGTEFPRFFDKTITQEAFDEWMKVFYKYRGGLLTGGICIKEFLDLKFYGDKTNEYRVFYVNHEVATVSPNSAQPNYAPRVPKELVEKYRNLGSTYYTVDYAELADGSWRVIEAGDGSVSGLSENQDAESYFRALWQCFK